MAGTAYIADPASAVTEVALDGLTLLFHAPSGMTHIVASPAPEILDALREGPADAAELLRRLRARFEFDGDEAIHARLAELEAAGLVRRA
jgi:PqqD family protein of HPr-rel-A system